MDKKKKDSKKIDNILNGKKVLMVEDDPYLREFYRRLMEREGVDMVIADDGEEGYEMVTSEKPDLILLDILLPGITGIEFLQRLKTEKVEHAPIIVLTDLDQAGVEEKARELGAVDYLPKHETDIRELKRRVTKIFSA